jgi:hypothetical protein
MNFAHLKSNTKRKIFKAYGRVKNLWSLKKIFSLRESSPNSAYVVSAYVGAA